MQRFLLDAMLGSLATYLRMCGYDAAYTLDREATTDEAVLAWGRDEARTVVTRDRELAAASPDAVALSGRDVTDQLAELQAAGFDLSLPDEPTRCSHCNGDLEPVDPDEPRPAYAPPAGERPVWRCVDCDQHYWRGSHWEDVRETLAGLD